MILMTDPDFLNPPIEVIATHPRLDMIRARLKSAGMRPYEARDELSDTDPLLIDAASLNGTQLTRIRRQMTLGTKRQIILLAASNAPLLQDAITLRHETELATVPTHIDIASRKHERMDEGALRLKTTKAMTGDKFARPGDAPVSVLFLGDGSSRFLAIASALKTRSITVTAALTALTARNYMAAQDFSCTLIDADDGSESAFDFLDSVTGDHLLSSIPIIAMASSSQPRSPEHQALLSNATNMIDTDGRILDIAEEVCDIAAYNHAITPITPDLVNDYRVRDRTTGLFTGEFLERHLENQIESLRDDIKPLCFMTLKLISQTDGNAAARKALPDLARVVSAHLRQTDCAGRIDWSTIGISLRGTSYNGGVQLAKRLIESLGGETFGTADTPLPFGGSLSWRLVEKRRYHTAANLIHAGKTGPQTRILHVA